MDISKKIAEMKQHPDFVEKVGMVLVHNGVVRAWSRKDKQQVALLEVTPDYEKIAPSKPLYLKKMIPKHPTPSFPEAMSSWP